MIKITHNPTKAVGIAVLFHAIWNASLWSVGVVMQDASIVWQLVANMATIFLLIIVLWIILRRLIPFAVFHDEHMSS